MDIASIIKKLDISLIKVALLRIFNKSGLYDYVVDKANTAINMLLAAKATEVKDIVTQAKIAYAEFKSED